MVPPHRRARIAGRVLEPSGRALEPAGRALEPDGRAPKPAGLGGEDGGGGRTETRKTRKTEKISLCGDAIGHRPLRGRCPLTKKLTE